MENMNQRNKNVNEKNDVTFIEGIGTVTEVGELDMDKLVELLLNNKYITG